MEKRMKMPKLTSVLLPAALMLAAGLFNVARAGSAYTVGDVFVAIGSGQVNEYTPTGTLVQTLDTTTGSTYTAGMGFDSSGNLYVTDFSTGQVSQFDNSGNLLNASFISGQTNPESLAFDTSGNIYVGDADLHLSGANGTGVINEYNASGTLIGTTSALTQIRGTDWIDLQADQHTVFYTSEGNSILSVDTATNTQNTAFASGTLNYYAYALREIPTGTYAGDVLVADSDAARLVAPGGTILNTYALPGTSGNDFALNLDPNGTAFWTGDLGNGTMWEVDIATGNILQQWTASGTVGGVSIYGEITASGGGPSTAPVPEPGTLVLFACGLGLLGLLAYGTRLKTKVMA
jgi:hypothetical protein